MLCHKYNELNAVVYRKSYRGFWSRSDFGSGPDIYRGECEQRNSRTVHWMVSSIADASASHTDGISMQLFNVIGIMLSFFINYGISQQIKTLSAAKWQIPFALQMLPGILLLAGIFFQNESPRWLVEKNRLKDAGRALAHVRAKPVDDPAVLQELDEIVADFRGHEKLPLKTQLKAVCENKRVFYQASFAVILMFWQQWTGTNR
jgi:hypothetical protein